MSSILVTGATGSFGQAFIRQLLRGSEYERIIILSRDELKQYEMRMKGLTDERLRYFIGDVRDLSRLRRAFHGVDHVVHAAALKQVDSCEYNPLEAVKTNVYGTENVIEAALDCKVRKVLMIGTDKAVDPVNLYGSTKQTAERLIVDANAYSDGRTYFASTRYGNVINSRGSVLLRFLQQIENQERMTITDRKMTRFVLTLGASVSFVQECLVRMGGGEVFVPMLPAVEVSTIAAAAAWPCDPQTTGIPPRPGEKKHEVLVSKHEASRTEQIGGFPDGHYIVHPITLGISSMRTTEQTSENAPRLNIAGFRELAGLED